MAEGSNRAIRQSPLSSRRSLYLLFFFILVPTGIGFGCKLVDLFRVFLLSPDGAFAIVPIVNYLLATTGFALLSFWAAANGMFRQVENPKFDFFTQEAMLDRQENRIDGLQSEALQNAGDLS